MSAVLPRQPDDPGPYFAPLSFIPSIAGRELIYLHRVHIGEIAPRPWGRMRGYEISIRLPDVRPKIRADNSHQAKVFAMQEVQDWLVRAGLPLAGALR